MKNRIINDDCIIAMKELQENSVSLCITDPPYNYEVFGKDWDKEEIDRRLKNAKKNEKTLVTHIPYGSGLAGGVRNKRWYEKNRNNILEYTAWTEEWAKEVYRILKPGAFCLIFNSTRTLAHIQVAFESVGFYARDIIVWERNSGIPKGLNFSNKLKKEGYEDYDKYSNLHSCLLSRWEGIVVVQKPLENNYLTTFMKYNVGMLNAKKGDEFKSNIMKGYKRDKKDDFNTHITIKPKDLIKDLIETFMPLEEDNTVIDPFFGSGTTGLACLELNVSYIGIEIDSSYIDIINKRINNFTLKHHTNL